MIDPPHHHHHHHSVINITDSILIHIDFEIFQEIKQANKDISATWMNIRTAALVQ